MKAKEITEKILEASGNKEIPNTCDQIAYGDPETEVSKIVTTFMATVDVIRKAAACGAQMIITHEPTYFTGADKTDWLANDSVYRKKKELLDRSHLVIWRYHDHMHAAGSDQIYDGLLKKIGWEGYLDRDFPFPHCYTIPETTLRGLAGFFKEKLNMSTIQIVGDPEAKITRVGILVGGGSLGLGREEMPMQLMEQQNLDVIVCGDITEWTLCAYVRDAAQLGLNKSMLVVGHERSEEPGMEWMAHWLPRLVGLPVEFISAGEPFAYL